MFEEKMTNCPKCRKPILNGGVFTSPAKFTMRCPWCQVTLSINVMPKIITEIIEDVDHAGRAAFAQAEAPVKETVRMNDDGKGFKVVGYMYPADQK